MRYRVNMPPVIHQTLDGEVIAVNLDTGVYYSLSGVAADVWAAVEAGAGAAEAIDAVSIRYDAPRPVVERELTRFLDELREEALIVPDSGAAPLPLPAAADGQATVPFAEPVLHKYTDMQELLLLDPIHDVDEAGWPPPGGDDAQIG
jgi:hypothetical protein